MNPAWDAAQALLALAVDCLGAECSTYARQYVDTTTPVADCDTLAVIIGNGKAFSGSCVGREQISTPLEVHLIRCCDPVPSLTDAGGYTPPSPDSIEAAAACIARDAWQILTCVNCSACSALGAIRGVTACCDDHTGPPELLWTTPSGGCRGAIIRVPLVLTACCPTP